MQTIKLNLINLAHIAGLIICVLIGYSVATGTVYAETIKHSPTTTASPETVLTEVWPPYILAENKPLGTAANWLKLLLNHHSIRSQWQYLPYDMSFYYVSKHQHKAAFPFFKTTERLKHVLYSKPVFWVTSKVYYNRQYLNAEAASAAFKQKLKIGKVAGYSYGETLDQAITDALVFATEKQALTALFNNEINALPMTEGVMNYHLTHHFPIRKELIKPLAQYKDTSSLHVIAANNDQGQQFIDHINNALSELEKTTVIELQTNKTDIPVAIDVAQLVTSEGYPLITGQTAIKGDDTLFYALPQGTKVVVIQWNEKMRDASHSDRIYKTMMALSKVVILNGPHVGKELFVRNMHIELQ